jgi:hypothetical protein
MTSYLNTINSEGVDLNINNTAGYPVVIGNSLTSILGSRTFGASTIGAITGTSASFSTTLGVTGATTLSGGLTSTAGTTTLGTSTIGAITGTSASFSTTLGVTGLATFGSGGLTSTAGTTTLGASTIGAITGTSASFSSMLGVTGLTTLSGGLTSTVGATTLGASTIGAITGTSASFSSTLGVTGLTTLSGGLASTAGTTTLGASTIGAITGTSASFSSTLGVTGLTTLSGGLTSTAGATTLGASTIGAITGTSASFSSTLSSTGLLTANGGLTSTAGATTLGDSTIGAITGTTASFTGQLTSIVSTGTSPLVVSSTTNVANLNASSLNGYTFPSPGSIGSSNPDSGTFTSLNAGSSSLGATTIGAITGTSSSFSSTTSTTSNSTGSLTMAGGVGISNTTDAVSSTNGGTITTAGGVAIAKKLFVGGVSSFSNTIDMNNTKIINLATPTDSADAVTKSYVDLAVQGLDTKQSVVVATTASGTLATSFQNGSVIDGITLITGNRILIKDQASVDNGVYVVNASGSPTRALDFQIGSSVAGSFMFVEKGTINADYGWVCSSDIGSDLVGTDTLTFTQFSGAGSITAGTGLSKSGNTLSVNASQTQITSVGTLSSLTVSGAITGTSAYFSTTLGVTGLTSLRDVDLLGSTSGAISIRTQSISGTYNFNLPITSGTSGQLLTSGGGGSSAMTWSPVTGTGNVVFSSSPTIGDATIGIITGTSATFSSSTTSSSKTTGAITAVGGISTQENLNVGGYIGISGSSSGTISIRAQAVAGTYNYNLPTTAGSAGQVLTSAGGAGSPMTWETPSSGTITSIALTVPSFLSVTGSPLTTSGTLAVSLSGTALPVENGGTGATTLTTNAVLLGNGTGAIQSPSSITYSSNTLTFPKLISNDTTTTTSNSTGSILIAGGLGISNTTDATSSTNGGTFTTAGGLAVAKKIFVGTSLDVTSTTSSSGFLARGATSGTVSILPQSNAGTFNFNLPITAGSAGQVLASGGGGGSAMSWVTPAVSSAPQSYNTTGLQSQSTPVDVTGLNYTVGSFDISMTVEVLATTSLTQIFKLTGILSPSSGWSITPIAISGDDSLVDFNISAGGHVQYTSGTYSGFTSLTFTWAQFSTTQGLGYLALSGGSSGIVTITPQAVAGTYNYNLPITAGNSGEVLTSAGGGSSPMTWGKPWTVKTSFSAVNNQTSPANITGLVYSSGCFEVNILSTLIATTNLTEFFKVIGVKKGDSTWDMAVISQAGDISGVALSITSGGQIQYTSANSSGFTSLTLKWTEISENYS